MADTTYSVMRQLEGNDRWEWVRDFGTLKEADSHARKLAWSDTDELYAVFTEDGAQVIHYLDKTPDEWMDE